MDFSQHLRGLSSDSSSAEGRRQTTVSRPWHRALGELVEGHGKQEPRTLLEGLIVLLGGGVQRDTCRSNTVPQHV